ncbi:AraC family transcriptional regulator [Ruegeria sp. WL0004]|uniref:AraC family transcriptional regulator n=1 Tax=Ruegeria marisflavi TaxID=2984152 RepID=A0ABT2WTI5_9RHOB|nr:AraC family transcriptional regulator [Ruegeria sp. WL0004]MCU9838572.1 AraC family transcriptional regulator [Ruegeria sp. WL0004]
MNRLDLVYAPALSPVFGAAALPNSLLERIAEKAGLPGSIVDDPKGFVPLYATELFLDLVQRERGQDTFLFDSLSMDPSERSQAQSVVGVPLPEGFTSKEALEVMTQTFNGHVTGARFSSEIQGGRIWVLRTTAATEWSDVWSVLQYNLSIMLAGVRRTLKSDVRPVCLRLPARFSSEHLPEILDLPVELDAGHFGLAFDLCDVILADRMLGQTSTSTSTSTSKAVTVANPLTNNLMAALSECMNEFVISSPNCCSADRVANAFGLSTRSYRRKLAAIGTSHAQLLSNARLEIAYTMLSGRSQSITEIAYELGYGNPGDFTRFFKGRVGCTPMQYKQMHAMA